MRAPRSLVLGVLLSAALVGCGSTTDQVRHEAFCTNAPELLEQVTTNLSSVPSSASTAVDLLDDTVTELEKVQPPEDVAKEWERLVTAMGDMRDLVARADPTDPAANADLAPELQRLQPELTEAGTAIDDWGKANC